MLFKSYIDLLHGVQNEGELISPSNVSVNRSFQTKELTNVQLVINDFKPFLLNDKEQEYIKYELDWFLDEQLDLSSEDHGNCHAFLKRKAETLIGCVNRDGPNSNYGEMCLRMKNHIGVTQFEWIVEKLKKDKNSRHAVAFYNSPMYQYWSNDDFVCTLNQLFNIKDNKLNTTVNIRSNDLINCFRFDSLWYNKFQQLVLGELQKTYSDLQIGTMTCNICSAHYYIKDEEKLSQIYSLEKDNI